MAVLALEGAPGAAAQDIDSLMATMSTRRKAAQLFMPDVYAFEDKGDDAKYLEWVDEGIGGEWGCPCASRNSRSGRARCSSARSRTRISCTAWDDNPSNCAATARAICGLTPFEGVLPVSAGGHSAGFAAK